MPDMRSEPSPKTYRELLKWSGTLPCSPTSLLMVSKAFSTHGLWISSLVTVITWLLLEFCHLLFPSRLEFLNAMFCALYFFWFPSMISQIPWKILFISLLMTPPSAVPYVILLINRDQPLHSADLGKITSWSNTWNMSFNPDKSPTLTWSRRKYRLEPSPPPIYFLNNPLE